MNTRAAGRGTTTAGIAATTDAVTTVAAAGERGRQGTTRGVIYQPGSTLTKFGTFPENRTTSVSRSLTGSSTVPFHRGGRCFVRLPVSRSLTGSSTVPVHRKGGSRQRMSGPSTMSHPAMWTCPACGRPLTVALNPEGGEAGAHRPLEISRASAAAHACAPAARFPQFHNASSSSITGYEPASCQPWQPPVSAGAEDDEGVISQSEYTLTKPSSCPNHRDHVRLSGAPLASQPTISRFENGARRTVLYRMGRELAACVIERHRRRLNGRARRITIDLDPTDDLTHGAQQLTFFNGHYGGWCYLPMLGFLSFDREAEQYLCAAVLRPGKAVAADGTLGLLCRLLPLLRAAFPRARFLVRLDGGFATPEIFDFLDAEPRLDYVVAMAKNAVLQRHAESAMQVARAQSEVGGETAHVYTDTRYAAGTWDHERRVVIKAEVVRLGDREPRDNPRFVVTNLRQTPRFIYEKVYCARGDIENRIKELLDGLQIDRTSCCLFSANQLRVFLTAAAYVLMQELRLRAARTACARSQVTWLRDRLLKLGVHVVRSVRRVVLHLPRSTPHLEAWRHIALALGARAG